MYKLDSVHLVVVPLPGVCMCFVHSKRLDFHIVDLYVYVRDTFFSLFAQSHSPPANLSFDLRHCWFSSLLLPCFHLTFAN